MSKRTYRTVSVNDLGSAELESVVKRGERLILAVDIAKSDNKAALIQGEHVLKTIAWKAPGESALLLELVSRLRSFAPLEVVMESTGTYGDPLRDQLDMLDVPVFRVSAKHAHDAAELFDGVPSMHDAKASHLLGWLHLRGRSRQWTMKTPEARDLAAAAELYASHNEMFMACLGRLDAKLARHFPELTSVVDLENASTLALVARFGDPRRMAAQAPAARAAMLAAGGPLLAPEKVDKVIEVAKKTSGMRPTDGERAALMHLAAEANRQRLLKANAKKDLEAHVGKNDAMKRTSEVVGMASAAILFAEAGDPGSYAAPAAYIKALGLNLKEKSSGQHQGQLKITKRGPPLARKLLFMAVIRAIQHEPLFKAWFARKVEREGGKRKLKAIVALMRKLAAALWHVARGATYDPTKLIDARRLGLAN